MCAPFKQIAAVCIDCMKAFTNASLLTYMLYTHTQVWVHLVDTINQDAKDLESNGSLVFGERLVKQSFLLLVG